MRVRFRQFSGEFPRLNPALLPDAGATDATNVRLASGAIQPLYGIDNVVRGASLIANSFQLAEGMTALFGIRDCLS